MRVLALTLSIVFGAFCVMAAMQPAEAGIFQNWKDKREPKKQQHIVKKVTKLKTKVEKKGVTKHIAHKAKRLKKKAVKHHMAERKSPTTDVAFVPLPDRKPQLADNALVRTAMMQVGQNPTGWSHNWCGHYLDMLLREAGYSGGGNLAREYASYGRPVPAQPGAIAVMPHHVGIVAEVGDGYVTLVSGNHGGKSGNRVVGVGRYPMSRIMAFRMPA